MKYISIAEFQNLSGLSDEAMMELLRSKKLRLQADERKGLQVDVAQLEDSDMVEAIINSEKKELEVGRELIKERLNLIITGQLELILERALNDVLK